MTAQCSDMSLEPLRHFPAGLVQRGQCTLVRIARHPDHVDAENDQANEKSEKNSQPVRPSYPIKYKHEIHGQLIYMLITNVLTLAGSMN